MKFHFLFFGFLLAQASWAQYPNQISFSTQGEVDSFAINYPGCETLGIVKLNGTEITNLVGLNSLTEIDDLRISATNITSLEGLNNLKKLSDILLHSNTNLVDISALSGLLAPMHKVSVLFNSQLDDCNLLCDFIVDQTKVVVQRNGENCRQEHILRACGKWILGDVFYDENRNKIHDQDELGVSGIFARESEFGFWDVTDEKGVFGFQGVQGTSYFCAPQLDEKKWILTTDSSSFSFVYDSISGAPELSFGVVPVEEKHDVELLLYQRSSSSAKVIVKNNGSFWESGHLVVDFDEKLRVNVNAQGVDNYAKKVTWDFDSIPPYGVREFYLSFDLLPSPPFTLNLDATLYEDKDSDIIRATGHITKLFSRNINVYECTSDVYPIGDTEAHLVKSDETLTYKFSFVGEGANELMYIDLGRNVDPTTFELVSSSFGVSVKIDGPIIRFVFPVKEPFSYYQFIFRIKPYIDTPEGTIIRGRMSSPVVFCSAGVSPTLAYTTIVSVLRPWESGDADLLIGPNPTKDFFRLQWTPDIKGKDAKLLIINTLGQKVKTFDVMSNKRYFVDDLTAGVYHVIMYGSEGGVRTAKLVKY